ncbi:MAG: ribonuclease D [Candidatus Thioglobus sp.]|nr:MAG: ribonuclease D [Candidatus Thioglobus sp.]
MIDNNKQLTEFLHSIKDDNEIAIDTEFKWVSTYYPRLCLLQIASKNVAECIDILALDDLTPLFDKLYQPNILWIAHAARNDIEVLYRYSKRLPAQVFDTQIAADFLKDLRPEISNFGAQISYKDLTQILQGVSLDKAYSRLDWSIRPLPEKAIEYALDDVVYLIKNYYQLKTLLEKGQKLNWLLEDGQSLLDSNLYEVDIFQAYNRLKGLWRLPQQAQLQAAYLAAWREQNAINKNKPRKWLLADNDLLDIAMGKRNLSVDKQQQFNIFLANNPDKIKVEIDKNMPPTPEEKAQKLSLQKLIQEKANQYNLTTEIIANGKTLLRYIRGDQSVKILSGWRYNLLKKELKCKTI